jgi:hypothetical protein
MCWNFAAIRARFLKSRRSRSSTEDLGLVACAREVAVPLEISSLAFDKRDARKEEPEISKPSFYKPRDLRKEAVPQPPAEVSEPTFDHKNLRKEEPSLRTYRQIDMSQWTAKIVGKSAQGSPTICIYDEVSGSTPRFCLYDNDECGTLVFPLEHKDGWGEKPAFMSGSESSKKVESLDLTITLEGEQLQHLRRIETWCKKMALEKSAEWFGKKCNASEIDVMFTAPCKVDESGNYAPHVSTRMVLGGCDRYLTQVTYVQASGTALEGAGWEFVEPLLGANKWRQNRARMVIEARRIWVIGRKFGMSFFITDLAVREQPERRQTPFKCDRTVDGMHPLGS